MSVTSIVLPSLSSKLFFPTVSPLAVDLRGLIVFTMPTRVSLCSYLFFMQCRYFVYFLRFAMPVGCFCNEMFNQMANCSMKYFSRSYNPRLLMCQVSTIHVCLCVRCLQSTFAYVSGVLWPINVNLADHQLGESVTVVWKHPPCHQTNYISGFVVAYRKSTGTNCNSSSPGE